MIMKNKILGCILLAATITACNNNKETASTTSGDSLVMQDIVWDSTAPAGMSELQIPSGANKLQGFIYKPNGKAKHPTLLMLHGYPGNEKNLDLAQAVRAHGWNVIYFDYSGSWASTGEFSFRQCVEDVKNVVAFCKKYSDSLKIDTARMALFGHSMGGWVGLKSLQIPEIKKGFVLSTWNIYGDVVYSASKNKMNEKEKEADDYFVLNKKSGKELFAAVMRDTAFHNLVHDGPALQNKEIIMLDEHPYNKVIADSLKIYNKASFEYEVWKTDHPFTNKRISLIKKVIAFLDK